MTPYILPRTSLLISRDTFQSQLNDALEKGIKLEKKTVNTVPELNEFKISYSDWDDFNSELLKSSFNNTDNEYKHDYDTCNRMLGMDDYISGTYRPNNPDYQLMSTKRSLASKLANLKQLLNKVSLIPCDIDSSTYQKNENSDNLIYDLHPTVKEVAGKLFIDGHYRQALLDTYIALSEVVKSKSGLLIDNTPVMQSAFSPKSPKIKLSEDNDEQQGYMWLFSGAMMALRNPSAHKLGTKRTPQETLEWLTFASALFRMLDNV